MDGAHPLVAKFERSVALSQEERSAVAAIPFSVSTVIPGEAVSWAGDQPERSVLILQGLLSTSKAVAHGTLQITAFHIPGDMPDLCGLHLDVLDSDVGAITGSELALIAHDDLRRLCGEHPRLAALLWRTTLVDSAIHREWVVNVGQRGAVARVAHLLCEVMTRMTTAGLADGDSCQLDLGPGSLSDGLWLARRPERSRRGELARLRASALEGTRRESAGRTTSLSGRRLALVLPHGTVRAPDLVSFVPERGSLARTNQGRPTHVLPRKAQGSWSGRRSTGRALPFQRGSQSAHTPDRCGTADNARSLARELSRLACWHPGCIASDRQFTRD